MRQTIEDVLLMDLVRVTRFCDGDMVRHLLEICARVQVVDRPRHDRQKLLY